MFTFSLQAFVCLLLQTKALSFLVYSLLKLRKVSRTESRFR